MSWPAPIIEIEGTIESDPQHYWYRFALGEAGKDAPNNHGIWLSVAVGDDYNDLGKASGFFPDDTLQRLRDAIDAHLKSKANNT